MPEYKYKKAIKNAAAHKQLGQTTIYLDEGDDDLPWQKVEAIEEGSMWRLNVPISVYFIAKEAGLTFKWSFDFEGPDSNGLRFLNIDMKALRAARDKLPLKVRPQLVRQTAKVLKALEKTRDEWTAHVNRITKDIEDLASL